MSQATERPVDKRHADEMNAMRLVMASIRRRNADRIAREVIAKATRPQSFGWPVLKGGK